MAIRGTGIQASSASSYTVAWPSGTLAGDFAVLLVGHAYPVSATPTGWTANNGPLGGSYFIGSVYSKTLTSADITAGSVTVTMTGTYDGCLAIVTFVGGMTLTEADMSQNPTGSASIVGPTTVSAGAFNLYFGANRAASTNTCNRGVLQRQANDGSAASGCLYIETSAPGAVAPTFTYSVAGAGNYQGSVVVNLPPTPSVPTASNNTLLSQGPSGSRHQIVKAAAYGGTGVTATPVPVAANLAGGIVSTAYSETLTAQGGISPYTYAVTAGTLPAGLALSSGGVISGTPTAAATSSFTVTVTDSTGATGSQGFSITVATPSGSGGGGVFAFLQ